MSINTRELTAWLTINRACNLRCRWCYARMTGFSGQDMSLAIFLESLALLESLEIGKVILIGGEPTIHPLFFEFLAAIRDRNMTPYLVTNAVALSDPGFVRKIAAEGISAITISLKAFNQSGYKLLTGVDAFEQVVEAVRTIQDEGIPNVVNVTLSVETMSDTEGLLDFMRSTGAKSFSLDTGKPIILPDGSTNVEGMGSSRQVASFFMEAYPRFKAAGISFMFKIALPFCLFPEPFIEEILHDGNIMTGCQMATGRGLIIDPVGNIIPCNHLCNMALGHISSIKGQEDYLRYRDQLAVSGFYSKASSCPTERCTHCKYWQACGAGCRLYWLHYGAKDLMGNFPKRR